jgi:hypothetical protein
MMGMFRATVVATGNHGCQRDEHRAAPGADVEGCGRADCTDCITREYVARLKASGATIQEASIHHWPGQMGEVVDNLVTKKRIGTF